MTKAFSEKTVVWSAERFVLGDSNKSAYEIVSDAIKKRRECPVPVVLYGPTGTGKTHMLFYAMENCDCANARFIAFSDFIGDYLQLIRKNVETGNDCAGLADGYVKKFDDYDMIVVDDLHTLLDKHATQELTFELVVRLAESDKLVIIATDTPFDNYTVLSDKLRSHYNNLRECSIQNPDDNLKRRIIDIKLRQTSLELDDDSVEWLIKRSDSISHIRGLINKITLSVRDGKKISLTALKRITKEKKV